MSDLSFVNEILQMEPAEFKEKKKAFLFKSERPSSPEFGRLDTAEIKVLKHTLKSIHPTTLVEIVYLGENGASTIKCYVGPVLGCRALVYLTAGPQVGRWCSVYLPTIVFVSEVLV